MRPLRLLRALILASFATIFVGVFIIQFKALPYSIDNEKLAASYLAFYPSTITNPILTRSTIGSTTTTTTPNDLDLEMNVSLPDVPPVYSAHDVPDNFSLSELDVTIPRRIHQTWKDENIPVNMGRFATTWMTKNPTWEYWFWTDKDADDLVRVKFPQYYKMFRGYPKGIFRADAMRYYILHEYGGIYADLDMENFKPLEPLIHKHHCVISQEPYPHAHLLWNRDRLACNAFMASRPRHPLFKLIIESLPRYKNKKIYAPVSSTGPIMLDNVMTSYESLLKNSTYTQKDAVYLGSPEMFMPTYDRTLTYRLKRQCRPIQKVPRARKTCDDLKTARFRFKRTENTYTDHHWVHTYVGSKKILNKQDNISKFVPKAKMASDILRTQNITRATAYTPATPTTPKKFTLVRTSSVFTEANKKTHIDAVRRPVAIYTVGRHSRKSPRAKR